MKSSLTSWFGVGLFCAAAVAGGAQEKKQNVLFIALDDLKPVLGCYGDPLVKTPNIDRLAARGTVFLQNYCQQAVCGPTRASLMTGRRPDHTRVWDLKTRMRDENPDILTLPQYFREQGYTTAGIGKIYDPRCIDNGKDQDKPSWSVPYHDIPDSYYHESLPPVSSYYQNPATRALATKYTAEAKAQGLKVKEARDYVESRIKPSTENADLPDHAYKDGAMTIRAQEILSNLAQARTPFFFAVGFARPHLPFAAPKKYWDLYRRDDMPVAEFQQASADGPAIAYHNSGELRLYSDITSLVGPAKAGNTRLGLPLDKQKELLHGYYATVSYVDAQVGKLLDTLDALALTESTTIVLWGDHGWHLGDHDLWCKHSNFEQATRAPLVIASPGFKPGKAASLSEFVDVFPTLCELAGLAVPRQLEGKSLVPVLRDAQASVKEYAVSQYPRGKKMGYSIRTAQHRLTWWMKDGFRGVEAFEPTMVLERELYDYVKDPLETVNVAEAKAYAGVVADLNAKMTAFFQSQRAANN